VSKRGGIRGVYLVRETDKGSAYCMIGGALLVRVRLSTVLGGRPTPVARLSVKWKLRTACSYRQLHLSSGSTPLVNVDRLSAALRTTTMYSRFTASKKQAPRGLLWAAPRGAQPEADSKPDPRRRLVLGCAMHKLGLFDRLVGYLLGGGEDEITDAAPLKPRCSPCGTARGGQDDLTRSACAGTCHLGH
jgi:hypothetical protein